MRKQKVLLGLASLAASTTLLVDTAHADRRTSLGGNLLIEDADDIFPFPQRAVQHRNMIRLDYGTGNAGNGVLTLGTERAAYGIALHRGDLLSPDVVRFDSELQWLSGVGDPFAAVAGADGAFTVAPGAAVVNGGATLPATVFDLFYARAMGDNAFGLRLGMGRGIQAIKVDGETERAAQTFIAAQAGYSILPQQGFKLDLSGNVVIGFGNTTALDAGGDQEDISSGLAIRAGLLGRGYYPLNDLVDLGFIAHASFDNQRIHLDGPDTATNYFNFGVMGGIGPSIHTDTARIAAYAGVRAGVSKDDPDTDTDDDHVNGQSFAVPTVNMAAEVQLLDWLYVRTGAEYNWNLNRVATKEPDASERASNGQFSWRAGLGVAKGGFAFDGVVQNNFLTSGPQFIGGNANGFLAMASLTYKFGDVFSGSSTPAQEVQEPAPAPEPPPPPPAPAYEPPPAPEPPAAPEASGDASGEAEATSTSVSASGGISGSIGTP